jgi:hypothetical protein
MSAYRNFEKAVKRSENEQYLSPFVLAEHERVMLQDPVLFARLLGAGVVISLETARQEMWAAAGREDAARFYAEAAHLVSLCGSLCAMSEAVEESLALGGSPTPHPHRSTRSL